MTLAVQVGKKVVLINPNLYYREDIFVVAARKELGYVIKATYSNLVYSLYEPLYSFNTLVLLLNSIFVKTCFNTLVLVSLQR